MSSKKAKKKQKIVEVSEDSDGSDSFSISDSTEKKPIISTLHDNNDSVAKKKRPRTKVKKEAMSIKDEPHPNESNNRRGQAFSEPEIKVLLLGIYEGKDNSKVADKYLEAPKQKFFEK